MDCNSRDAIQNADRCKIVQAYDTEAYEAVIECGGSDHGDLLDGNVGCKEA